MRSRARESRRYRGGAGYPVGMNSTSQPLVATSTQEFLAGYREQGFAMLGSILNAPELADIRAEEARFRPQPLRGLVDAPNTRTVFRSQVCGFSPIVRKFATEGRHLDRVAEVVGPDVALYYTQFVTKLPDADVRRGEFPWHQDLGYVAILPMLRTVTVWVALDDVDETNGCVWVQPGSHHGGLLSHQQAHADTWHLTVPVTGDGIPARLKAGEAVAFTGLTLHRSKSNATNAPRRGFFMEYVPAEATEQANGNSVLEKCDTWVVRGRRAV